MSEVEMRQTLVGPTGKCLKFLNNKNNIESLYLQKKLKLIEREKSYSISLLDNNKIDAMEFMKNIKKREPESQHAKILLERSDTPGTPEPIVPRIEAKRKIQRNRKPRLAQTAPASMQHKYNTEEKPSKEAVREVLARNPRAKLDRSKTSLETGGRNSVYLQLGGANKDHKSHFQSDDSDDDERNDLPKPNPRTLLDVMIGLNAFSHVPPPRGFAKTPDMLIHRDSHNTLTRSPSNASLFDSTENIAQKFLQQWRSRIASRRQSIYDKLAGETPNLDTSVSSRRDMRVLSSVPEFKQTNSTNERRKSKWTMTHKPSIITPAYLPGISGREDCERRELFQAWVKERKDELKSEVPETPKLNPFQKMEQRRTSFVNFLKDRNSTELRNDENDDNVTVIKFTDPYEVDDGPHDIGNVMKTILNIKKRFKDPIDFRLKKFYQELDRIKERDAKAQGPLTEKAIKRRWKVLMKGIDAALADSSDEDDNDYHTI